MNRYQVGASQVSQFRVRFAGSEQNQRRTRGRGVRAVGRRKYTNQSHEPPPHQEVSRGSNRSLLECSLYSTKTPRSAARGSRNFQNLRVSRPFTHLKWLGWRGANSRPDPDFDDLKLQESEPDALATNGSAAATKSTKDVQDLQVKPNETYEKTEGSVPVVFVIGARGDELVDPIEVEQERRGRDSRQHQRDPNAEYASPAIKVWPSKGHHEKCHAIEDERAEHGHRDNPRESRRYLDNARAVEKPNDQRDPEGGADGLLHDPVILGVVGGGDNPDRETFKNRVHHPERPGPRGVRHDHERQNECPDNRDNYESLRVARDLSADPLVPTEPRAHESKNGEDTERPRDAETGHALTRAVHSGEVSYPSIR
jgi:hypothetical protein